MDTGAMYRAFAWKVMRDGLDPGDEEELEKVVKQTTIELKERDGHLRVFLDGADVSEQIRTPELSQMASKVSALGGVRERMVELQRSMGVGGGVVAEGRDIGTIVFPEADVKIYLDASSGERARRRFEELDRQGQKATLEETLKEMGERDRRDKGRTVAPLAKADDAIVIDSTHCDAETVVERVLQEVQKKTLIR
jgi:cytidylate kinase